MEGRPRYSGTAQTGVERSQSQADSGVGFDSHRLQYVEEPLALTVEEPIGSEACNGSDGASKSIGQRTNDCDMGEVRVDEFARDGKDQAGLNQAGRLYRRVVEEIRKRQAGYGVLKRRDGLLHSVSGEVDPFEKMSDLVSTNTKGDLKDFGISYFLTHGSVET